MNTYEIIGGDNRAHGPVTGEEVYQWIREGRADHNTMARVSGGNHWQPLGSFPEFVGPLQGLPWVPLYQPPPKSHGMAVTSLVLGIVSIVFVPFGLLFGVPAVYCGHVARVEIARQPGEFGGHGLAIGGLVTGYIGTAMGAVSLVLFVMLCLALTN